jgi:hypothetical protein
MNRRSRSTRWLSVFLSACLLAPAIRAADDCYLAHEGNLLLLGNSKTEFTIDAATGVILQMRNKTADKCYLGPGRHGNFRMVYSTFALHGAASGDPWSAAYGTLIDGSKQVVASTELRRLDHGVILEVSYNRIRLEKHSIDVGLTYSIQLDSGSEESKWKIRVDNRDAGTVRELQFPYLSGLTPFPALAMPNQAGQLLRDPAASLSDEVPEVYLEYPARASMQWFDYYSAQCGLYMASYDRELNYTLLHFGRSDGDPNTTAMWITKYAFAVAGATWESPVLGVALHTGDWHWGGDTYRRWLESWVPPSKVSRRVAEMVDSDSDVFIKDASEKTLHNYDDAARLALQRPVGTGVMFVGWMYNGHDTYYPEYSPIPDLGGVPALTAAVDRIHAAGRLASAYVNLRLAAGKTATYAGGMGWGVLVKGPGIGVAAISSGELHEDWNSKWGPAEKGEGFHVVMCPSVKPWQDHMVAETSRVLREYHFDGIFLDQPGSFYAELCYDKHHGHSNPANAWGPGYLTMLRRIREATRAIDPDSYLWIEGMNDAYAQYLDFGMDKNPLWEPMRAHPQVEPFPEMWRYTRPHSIIVNTPKAYSFPPSQDNIYGDSYNFVMGIRGQDMLTDLDNSTRDEQERRKVVLGKIARLLREGSGYFFHGEFRDDVGLVASPAATFAKVYRGDGGFAIALWNTSDKQVETELKLKVPDSGFPRDVIAVTSLESGRPFPSDVQDGTLRVLVRLGAHDIDAAVIGLNPSVASRL